MHRPRMIIAAALVAAMLLAVRLVRAQEPTPTEETPGTPSAPLFGAGELIDRVNSLRTANGLPALATHPALMQIAQTEANGIAAGYGGHWRPNNLTLGQWLLSLGYPLSGDLSMDGYRSENWFSADLSSTLDDVTQSWQADAPHRDTMFSADRSDIGAALAVDADGQMCVVLETALRTSSGKMQSDASAILTGIPETQMAYASMATQAAQAGVPLQYSMPVMLSTARPNGDVYHDVKYGQSLWSIAITYHTTIKQLQTLNRLPTTMVYEGQKLLVMQGATQPAPTGGAAQAPVYIAPAMPASTQMALQPALTATIAHELRSPADVRTTTLSVVAIIIAALVLAGVFAAMGKRKEV